ncbi:MAG: TonB-dependent receptor [Bermanella sp.]
MHQVAFCILFSAISEAAFSTTVNNMDDLFNLSLEELVNIKITSATRHEESLSSVPASITVYSREQIRALGIDRLTTLMNFVPGFQSQRNDTAGFVHTFSSRGTGDAGDGRNVLVLLDGQRLNNDWSGGIYLSNGIINLEKIERIEFIRGPGSAIYGSNAFTGVINLISQAENEAHVALTTLNGSGTVSQTSLQWQQPFNNIDTQWFVNFIDDEGQRLKVFDPFKDAFVTTRDPYQFKEVYLKTQSQNLKASFYHSVTQAEQFYVLGFVSNQENHMDATSSHVDLQYTKAISKNITLNSKASLSRKRFDLAGIISPALPPNELGITGEIEEQEPQAEITLSYLGDEEQKALVGVEWRRPKIIDSDANLFGVLDSYLPQAPLTHRTIYGLFAQYQGDVSEQLHYVLGLRHDDYSNFGAHSSPRGGLIWQYDQKQTFKWLYGESFRAPSRGETDVENSSAIVANPDLNPEVARTTELIWQSLHRQTFFATTLFYTEFDNLISDAQTTPIERFNSGSEAIAGMEFEWHQQWSERLSSRVNASWILESTSGANIEAEFFSGMSLVYLNEKFSGALMLNHHSSKDDSYVQGTEIKERDVGQRSFLDANFRWFLPLNFETYLKLNNITNEKYNSVALRTGISQGVPNRSSSAMIGLRLGF